MIRFSGGGTELYGRIRPRLGKYRRNYVFWEMGGHAGPGETSSALIADESATPTQITSAAALESH
jgi:hypothetical protein